MSEEKKEKPEYEENKAYHSKVEGMDFYAVSIGERKLTEVEFLKIGGKRETEVQWGALVVKDPKYGLMPHETWSDMRSKQIAKKLSEVTGSPVLPRSVSVHCVRHIES